jgi:hypothetical protein
MKRDDPDPASGAFCCVPLQEIWYGIKLLSLKFLQQNLLIYSPYMLCPFINASDRAFSRTRQAE